MTDAFTRNFGVLFTEISIERAARKCCRAAITWGGDALVFVDSERRCSAVMPNTVAARNALKNCSTGFIGQYRANSDGGDHVTTCGMS